MNPQRINKLRASATPQNGLRTLSCVLGCFVMSCLFGVVVGCTSSATTAMPEKPDEQSGQQEEHHHDHGHRPESYSAALAQIKNARDEVKAAFDAGTPHACDDALHVLAEVLNVLPEVAAETDLPKEDWSIVKDQSKVLFDEFMKIHDGFHGGDKQGASFDSVSEVINESIAMLESKAVATGETVSATSDADAGNHDHDHDSHEGHEH